MCECYGRRGQFMALVCPEPLGARGSGPSECLSGGS